MKYTAKQYAQALHGLTNSEEMFVRAIQDLEQVAGFIVDDADVEHFFSDNSISIAQQEKVLHDVIRGVVGEQVYQLLLALVLEKQISLLKSIIEHTKQIAQDWGVTYIDVTSAIQLTRDQRAHITEQLIKKFVGKVNIEFIKDEQVIGGLRLRINNSRLWDSTVAGRFQRLRQHIALCTI